MTCILATHYLVYGAGIMYHEVRLFLSNDNTLEPHQGGGTKPTSRGIG
jgi:hypothetical protein